MGLHGGCFEGSPLGLFERDANTGWRQSHGLRAPKVTLWAQISPPARFRREADAYGFRLVGDSRVRGFVRFAAHFRMAEDASGLDRERSHRRMLCLYGTEAQRQKLHRATGRRLTAAQPLNSEKDPLPRADGLEAAFQALGTLWLQELLGCCRVPCALSKGFLRFQGEMSKLCFRCSVQDRLGPFGSSVLFKQPLFSKPNWVPQRRIGGQIPCCLQGTLQDKPCWENSNSQGIPPTWHFVSGVPVSKRDETTGSQHESLCKSWLWEVQFSLSWEIP